MAETDDRTEAPTQRRLDQARSEGQVPISRDMVSFTILAMCGLYANFQGAALVRGLADTLAGFLAGAHESAGPVALERGLRGAFTACVPYLAVTCAAAAAATLLQTRFLLNLGALKPKFSRLDPRPRLKRQFGFGALVEAVRATAKLGVVVTGAGFVFLGYLRDLSAALSWSVAWLNGELFRALLRVDTIILAAFFIVVILEVAAVQWQHFQRMRMSRTEIRDEYRDMEGDPLIKRRIRQMQQARARRRMIAAVPDATVVLVNPTHYAVALAYDRNSGEAPRVVAKGLDEVAARIRIIAEESRVPVVSNPPLARALYSVAVGAEIPAEHYRVVAEVIAYVWRLRGLVAAPRSPAAAVAR
ncbi:MAG: EscU/YscU/HrcU family type III secretion system export apparatus switch protein [Alphaproteobacteria bacterium]|nr:EscU/YscU/HrcU family type III secretion system export apparatus switch protein [Alphaproteobacteria bacterium]